MRSCLHCSHEGPDETFAHYRGKDGVKRARNVCLSCHRFQAADRQARYLEKNGDRVRKMARDRKFVRYHSDPEFRQRCINNASKKTP